MGTLKAHVRWELLAKLLATVICTNQHSAQLGYLEQCDDMYDWTYVGLVSAYLGQFSSYTNAPFWDS